MTDVKYLSDKEIVNELYKTCNPSRSLEESERRMSLKKEILRRLKAPWMDLKKIDRGKLKNASSK